LNGHTKVVVEQITREVKQEKEEEKEGTDKKCD
jgi:hypothetical protein